MTAPKMKLYLVEWEDARGVQPHWQKLDELVDDGICLIRSVGWLVRGDLDDPKVLVPHLGVDPDQGCGHMTIPASAVRRMVELVELEEKEPE